MTYRRTTIEPWYDNEMPESQSHRLYMGATLQNPVNSMFSFFPCVRYEEFGKGFHRPIITLPGKINPNLSRNVKISKNMEMGELKTIWDEVVEQVKNQKLMLGIFSQLPQCKSI